MDHEGRRRSGNGPGNPEKRDWSEVGDARLRRVAPTLGSDGVTSWVCLGRPPRDTPGEGKRAHAGPAGRAGAEAVILACVNVAGFQYHHGMHPKVLWRMDEGDRLVPVRESGNPHDCWAIAIYTHAGARIGYLPRGCNQPVAMMMDQGWPIRMAVASVDPEAEPWERVRVTVWTEAPGRTTPDSN